MTKQEAREIFRRFMIFPDVIRQVGDRTIAYLEAPGAAGFGKSECDEVAHIADGKLYADRVYSLDGKIVA